MPLNNYGVLKGRAIGRRLGSGSSPHYQIHLVDEAGTHYRIAINVRSQLAPSELMYYIKPYFVHPLTSTVEALPSGFSRLAPNSGSGALDLIRGNLLQPGMMTPLPPDLPGPDNDLNEKLDQIVQRAMADEEALVYAFGERWGPESNKADKYFGFLPGNGIHDIHMNQGNVGSFIKDDGVWQDGGALFHFPLQRQWTAVFLKFQSQSWHTDDRTGHTLAEGEEGEPRNPDPIVPQPTEALPDGLVRIVSAMVNSIESPEKEWVNILNTSDRAIPLADWQLADKQKAKMPLSGTIEPGATLRIDIQPPVALSNKGGIITLLNQNGLKVHGVSYTRQQANQPGWTIVF
ncbi:DUF2278 family protein [Nitrosospira multiformis]|uniref:Uncharacterized protein YukJ n=1 Tax=Nitrosospira multiformis TaxID=1231 RepID=A0A1I7ILK4_9PROT|nr:DUF2278 family protein [Nitrosospira multiformis]SFU73774.1 Uncharacterized protein YukJ [Nitrosospira multiformis]